MSGTAHLVFVAFQKKEDAEKMKSLIKQQLGFVFDTAEIPTKTYVEVVTA